MKRPVNDQPAGCYKEVAKWLEASKYRSLIHRHDGCFVAVDDAERKVTTADTLPLLADRLLNWPDSTDRLENIMWIKVPEADGIQRISDTTRIGWLEDHAWEQNEANPPYKAFCQIVLTHYGSVVPLRAAIDLAMQNDQTLPTPATTSTDTSK